MNKSTRCELMVVGFLILLSKLKCFCRGKPITLPYNSSYLVCALSFYQLSCSVSFLPILLCCQKKSSPYQIAIVITSHISFSNAKSNTFCIFYIQIECLFITFKLLVQRVDYKQLNYIPRISGFLIPASIELFSFNPTTIVSVIITTILNKWLLPITFRLLIQ